MNSYQALKKITPIHHSSQRVWKIALGCFSIGALSMAFVLNALVLINNLINDGILWPQIVGVLSCTVGILYVGNSTLKDYVQARYHEAVILNTVVAQTMYMEPEEVANQFYQIATTPTDVLENVGVGMRRDHA